jgi:O-antigen/teichoic acid export membrane protein
VRRSVPGPASQASRRLAHNFAALSGAEVACRALSVVVTLSLASRLGTAGYGRVEFAFNLVYWFVLLVREGFDVIAAREIARHPPLIRPMVNRVLGVRIVLALALYVALLTFSGFALSGQTERWILALYGLGLITTALGIDYAFRSIERVGLVAISLLIRTTIYATLVTCLAVSPERVAWVPICLALGEIGGITLVWFSFARRFGWPRPVLPGRTFLSVLLRRGGSVYVIQVSQAVLSSVDLIVVGALAAWSDVGIYSAPHRMITAVLTFGVIFQQVVFPSLARNWRTSRAASRTALDSLVRALATGFVPLCIGTTVLSGLLVRTLLNSDYSAAAPLLALGVWRAPLFTLAFLYQSSLIALGKEWLGMRLLPLGALASALLAVLLTRAFGLPGACIAQLVTGALLALAGYFSLARLGRGPTWHHQLARPLVASLAMVPVVLVLSRHHVITSIAGGALTYLIALVAVGGIRRDELRRLTPART